MNANRIAKKPVDRLKYDYKNLTPKKGGGKGTEE